MLGSNHISNSIRQVSFFCFLLTQCFIFPIVAQTNDSFVIEEIEIVDFKPTDFVSLKLLITDKLIPTINGTSSYLANYSEAFVRSYGQGGFATISLDGLLPQHTQIYWNGLPVNTSTIGIADVSIYPLDNSSATNILKSADTYRFSGSNIGGAVMMENFYRSNSGFTTSIENASFGSWGTKFKSDKYFSKQGFKLKISAGLKSSSNDFEFIDYTQNPQQSSKLSNASYAKFYVQPGFEWRINSKNLWQVNLLYNKINRELPATIVSPNNIAKQEDNAFRFSNHWKAKVGAWSNNLIAGYTFDKFYYEDKSGDNVNVVSNYNANRVVLNEGLRRFWNRHYLQLGGNLIVDFVNGSDLENTNLTQGGLFAIWKLNTLKSKVEFTQSVRGEFHSIEKPDISGSSELKFQPFENFPIKLILTGRRSIKYPTVNDLYFKPSGNESLSKESAWEVNGKVALEQKRKLKNDYKIETNSSVAGYSIRLKDMIVWLPTNKIYWQPINLSKVHSRGLKISNFLTLSSQNKAFIFQLSQFYNLSISTNEANTRESEILFPNDITIGKQLPYQPKHNVKLNAYLEYKQAFLSINNRYTSERFITGSNSYFLQKYWLMDAKIGYGYQSKKEKHQLDFVFGLNNILGNLYYQEIAHIPMPGRNYQLTITYGFSK